MIDIHSLRQRAAGLFFATWAASFPFTVAALAAPVEEEALTVAVPHAARLSGAFGRVHVLEANDDERPDVVTTFGTVPVVLYAPSNSQTSLPILGCVATELAVLPALGRDEILAATAAGVTRYRYMEVSPSGRPGYLDSPLGDASLAGCRSLQVADLNGDGLADLSALAANGAAVLRAHGTPGGAFDMAPPIALAQPAERLVVLDWLGAPAFALVTGAEVRFVDFAGATLDGFQFVGSIVDAVRVRENAPSAGALAVLTVSGGGLTRVTVVRPGSIVDGPVDLGAMDGVAFYAGDIDQQGDDDLVVTGRGDGMLRVLMHGGPGTATYPLSGVSTLTVLDEMFDPSTQRANAVVADFDLDGDVDVFHLAEYLRAGRMARSDEVAHGGFAPELIASHVEYDGPSPHVFLDVFAHPLQNGAVPTELELQLWGELPNGTSAFSGAPSSFLIAVTTVPVNPADPETAAHISSPIPLGDHVWVFARGIDSSGATPVIGTDRVLAFVRNGGEGGGAGGSDNTQNGNSGTPPPPRPTPPVGGGG